MTDAISRQQVIEALGELATFTEDWSCHTWMYTDDVYNAIKQLPPIQPEIIRCKDCKHRYVEGDNVRYNTYELNHDNVQSDDWYCADAKRRKGDDMSRLISMEDAIRAIEEEWDGCCSEYPATQIIYDTTEAIERLPIIQPEIIRCKDCKWKNRHNCTRAVEVFIDDDKYCAWAERRTDE